MLPVTLTFDDGTTKKVDLTTGLYATFVYMLHGVSTEFTGKVTAIFSSEKKVDFKDYMYKPGYMCDVNYQNTIDGVQRPIHHPHHHKPQSEELEIRNYVEVEGAGKDSGRTVSIDLYTITNIFTIYSDATAVVSPDDSTNVQMIRVYDSQFQYSVDGINWIDLPIGLKDIATISEAISELDLNKVATKDLPDLIASSDTGVQVATAAEDIGTLQSKVADLESTIEALSATVQELKDSATE
jgi:hypothetical protein